MWRLVAFYGVLLASGTLALQWLDYQWMARSHSLEMIIGLMAAGFLGLGVYVGARVFATSRPASTDGNPQAQTALGISPRELTVLQHLAAGMSNKEIAIELDVSPNTIKTHVTRLFEKLEAKRRTEAVNKARQIGLLP